MGGSSMTVVVAVRRWASGATLDLEGDMSAGIRAIGGSLPSNLGTVTGYSTATLTLTGAGTVGGPGNTALPGLTHDRRGDDDACAAPC